MYCGVCPSGKHLAVDQQQSMEVVFRCPCVRWRCRAPIGTVPRMALERVNCGQQRAGHSPRFVTFARYEIYDKNGSTQRRVCSYFHIDIKRIRVLGCKFSQHFPPAALNSSPSAGKKLIGSVGVQLSN